MTYTTVADRQLQIAEQWLWNVVVPYAQSLVDPGAQQDAWRALRELRTAHSAYACRGDTAEAIARYLSLPDREAWDVMAIADAVVAEAISLAWRTARQTGTPSDDDLSRLRREAVSAARSSLDRDQVVAKIAMVRGVERFMDHGP